MLVENSIVIADFIRGLFIPIKGLTIFCAIAALFVLMYSFIEEKPEVRWWLIPIGLELLFALWFFSTFSLQPIA